MQQQCPSCQRSLHVKPEYAGKQVKCPCGHTMQMPARIADDGGSTSALMEQCTCGRKLRVPASAIGKQVKCPCGNTFVAGQSAASASNSYPSATTASSALARTSAPSSNDDWLSDIPAPQLHSPATNYAPSINEGYAEPPQRSSTSSPNLAAQYLQNAQAEQSRERARAANEGGSWEHRVFNGSVLGGLGMMLVAVLWFVGGLFAGYIFFYPPILFIIGLIGFFRGLLDGD